MANLTGLFLEAPAAFGSHQLVSFDGQIFYVELSRDADYLIGDAMLDMGGGRHPIPTTTRSRTSEAKTLDLYLDPEPRGTLKGRRDTLEAALANPLQLWVP